MTNDIIVSGFGGQGVMAIGKTLTEAGMKEGKEVSWLPSYGPEMRGGTANCSVVISDDPIVSPIVLEPTELIAMNLPSLIKFENLVQKGGTIFVNSSVVSQKVERKDVRAVYVDCIGIAEKLGNGTALRPVFDRSRFARAALWTGDIRGLEILPQQQGRGFSFPREGQCRAHEQERGASVYARAGRCLPV